MTLSPHAVLSPRSYVLAAGEGHRIVCPVGGPVVFKARTADTGGMLMAMENEVHAGEGPPLAVSHPMI